MAANSWNLAGTSWGIGNWGEQSDTTVTLTGIELTSSLGEVSAYNESGWGRTTWGDLDWGVDYDQTIVEVTGIGLTASTTAPDAYNESGWGRYFWGERSGGRPGLDVSVDVTGIGLTASLGDETVIGKVARANSPLPKTVIHHSRIFIQSLKENNIISCGKHFPGQGSAIGDTHEGYTDISESWTVKDLLPFDKLIQSRDLDMIMVSHVFDTKMDPNYPASLSHIIITNMLRNDLGFDGVVICDDPSMNAISDHYDLTESFELMLNAGIDLFCLGNNLNYDPDFIPKSVSSMCHLVESGKITETRIQESIDRINSLKEKYKIHG